MVPGLVLKKEKYLHEISRLIFRIENLRFSKGERIKRKRYFLILFYTLLIIISSLSLIDLFRIPSTFIIENQPKEFIPILFICFSLFIIAISIWVLTRKANPYNIAEFQNKSIKELKKAREELKKSEEYLLEHSAYTNALLVASFTSIVVVILVVLILIGVKEDIGENFNFPEIIVVLPIVTIGIMLIGEIIGIPKTPKAQLKLQQNLLFKVNEVLFISMDNSNLHPQKEHGRS